MKKLSVFIREVQAELSKIVWPSRAEFLGAVVVVLIIMAAFAIYLGLINYAFYQGILISFRLLVFGR